MASKQVKITLLFATILGFTTECLSFTATPSSSYGVPPHEASLDATHETSPISRTQYAYAYDIRDPVSGVYTSKKESRDGDVVFGNYVVEEADGARRTVYYTADPVRGFNADILRNDGLGDQRSLLDHPTQRYYQEHANQRSVQDHAEQVQPVQVPLPFAVPVVHAYVVHPHQQEAPRLPPPPPPPMHQLQFGTPVAISLAPAILTSSRTSSQSELELARYHTSLTSPTHSYSY